LCKRKNNSNENFRNIYQKNLNKDEADENKSNSNKYGILFEIISSNIKEIKDLIKDQNNNIIESKNKLNTSNIDISKLSRVGLNSHERSPKINLKYFDDEKLIKDYEVEDSQEQIRRLIENNKLRNGNKKTRKTNVNNFNSKNMNINFIDPRNENSLLFSSFNSDMYKYLNENAEINGMKENFSLDLTANKNNVYKNNVMSNLSNLNNEQKNNNLIFGDDMYDKTEETECQYDDVIFNDNQFALPENNKNKVINKGSFICKEVEEGNLENILEIELDDKRLLIDIDYDENFNSFDDDTCNILDSEVVNKSSSKDVLPIAELKYFNYF
jgi:hypothetical protein